MNRRTAIKWLHWLAFGLILYFYLVEPDESRTDPAGALSTHAGVGILLALVVGIWFAMFMIKGLAGRAGPKLPAPAKRAYPLMHKALYIGMPVMMITGGLLGLAAPYVIKGFGIIPLGAGNGGKGLYDFLEEIHEIAFDALIIGIVLHAVFHIWRHYWLKDNALRIMAPKILHKYL